MEYNNTEEKQDKGTEDPIAQTETKQTTLLQCEDSDNAHQAEVSDAESNNTGQDEEKNSRQVFQNHRTSLLSVLCILTFIGSGFSAFSNAIMWLSLPTLKEIVLTSDLYDNYFALFPGLEEQMMTMLEIPAYFYLLTFLLYIGSILGAVWMWKLQRKGFHTYTISQCLLILVSMLMMPNAGVPWLSIFWTGLFVTLYGIHLKYMNPIEQ